MLVRPMALSLALEPAIVETIGHPHTPIGHRDVCHRSSSTSFIAHAFRRPPSPRPSRSSIPLPYTVLCYTPRHHPGHTPLLAVDFPGSSTVKVTSRTSTVDASSPLGYPGLSHV
ncbi:hypothetical protein FPV67DRAFT_1544405, partial [Lyophyllum atratum]